MYNFYADTCDKFGWWGSKYLTKRFFEQLHTNYRHRVLFVAAYSEGDSSQPIGMSFCLTKGDQLYGRYWGSFQELTVYTLTLAITPRLNGRSHTISKVLTPALVDDTKNVAVFLLVQITVCTAFTIVVLIKYCVLILGR
jgi:hypothetical protein